MNEYKKLIDYLKNRINNIEEKLEKIENERCINIHNWRRCK